MWEKGGPDVECLCCKILILCQSLAKYAQILLVMVWQDWQISWTLEFNLIQNKTKTKAYWLLITSKHSLTYHLWYIPSGTDDTVFVHLSSLIHTLWYRWYSICSLIIFDTCPLVQMIQYLFTYHLWYMSPGTDDTVFVHLSSLIHVLWYRWYSICSLIIFDTCPLVQMIQYLFI